jgi:hypothetical protein
MEIAAHPPGLLSRHFFPTDHGQWVMVEKWNIDVPGCPLIRSPWIYGPFNDGPIFIRQVEVTAEEYQAARHMGKSEQSAK